MNKASFVFIQKNNGEMSTFKSKLMFLVINNNNNNNNNNNVDLNSD
jgi:hypothetical protein